MSKSGTHVSKCCPIETWSAPLHRSLEIEQLSYFMCHHLRSYEEVTERLKEQEVKTNRRRNEAMWPILTKTRVWRCRIPKQHVIVVENNGCTVFWKREGTDRVWNYFPTLVETTKSDQAKQDRRAEWEFYSQKLAPAFQNGCGFRRVLKGIFTFWPPSRAIVFVSNGVFCCPKCRVVFYAFDLYEIPCFPQKSCANLIRRDGCLLFRA